MNSHEERVVLLVEDMNDNCNLAGRVLEEERLLGVTEISNTMAHKLNQYLQVIMGYISLMTLEMDPEHQCYDYLNRILEQLENIRVTTYMLSNINRYAIIERPDGRRMFDLGHGCRGTCNPELQVAKTVRRATLEYQADSTGSAPPRYFSKIFWPNIIIITLVPTQLTINFPANAAMQLGQGPEAGAVARDNKINIQLF